MAKQATPFCAVKKREVGDNMKRAYVRKGGTCIRKSTGKAYTRKSTICKRKSKPK